jgi:hypothetical protein
MIFDKPCVFYSERMYLKTMYNDSWFRGLVLQCDSKLDIMFQKH